MRYRSVALAALIVGLFVNAPVIADDNLTLDDAFTRVVNFHPDLKVFRYTEAALSAEVDRAALPPPLTAGVSVENALGSGNAAGLRRAEITLSLASVLERGNKRNARLIQARGRVNALNTSLEAKRLDVLAEVARRYLDAVAAQALERVTAEDMEQRERTVAAATSRVVAGASPESVRLAAQAQLAKARLENHRIKREIAAAYRRLALLWGESDPKVLPLAVDTLALPDVPEFAAITGLLDRTPELRHFADEARLREARLQLALSARSSDIDWQVGVRRLQEGQDWALVGGFSLPLGSTQRAAPQIRAAESELLALDFERESSQFALLATLMQAHSRLASAVMEVEQSRSDFIPRLVAAEASAQRAYRAGALSYLEWAQLQTDVTAARRQEILTIVDAQRALIEIQRLTGEPFMKAHKSGETQP